MGIVLLVDDEQDFLDALKDSMVSAGFQIMTASSGLEALAIIKNEKDKIDCVLTDYRMPEMRGDELAYAIKHNTGIPVVIMTGDTTVASDVLFKAGISGIFHKPFDSENFIEFLKNNEIHVDMSRQRKFLRQKTNQVLQRIVISNGRKSVNADILNLSSGGFGVRLDEMLEPISTVQFIVKIEEVEVKGYMHCRWKSVVDQKLNAGFELDSLTKKNLANNPLFGKWVTMANASNQ